MTFTRQQIADAYDAFREATEANIAEEDNVGKVREDFDALVARLHREGSLMVNLEVIIADALWQRVNTRAGNTGFALLKDAANGQTSLPHDEWLDQVVKVGQSRRTTVRHLTSYDIEQMLTERVENVARATDALETAQRGAAVLRAGIAACGDIPTALNDGALSVEFAEPQEGAA